MRVRDDVCLQELGARADKGQVDLEPRGRAGEVDDEEPLAPGARPGELLRGDEAHEGERLRTVAHNRARAVLAAVKQLGDDEVVAVEALRVARAIRRRDIEQGGRVIGELGGEGAVRQLVGEPAEHQEIAGLPRGGLEGVEREVGERVEQLDLLGCEDLGKALPRGAGTGALAPLSLRFEFVEAGMLRGAAQGGVVCEPRGDAVTFPLDKRVPQTRVEGFCLLDHLAELLAGDPVLQEARQPRARRDLVAQALGGGQAPL